MSPLSPDRLLSAHTAVTDSAQGSPGGQTRIQPLTAGRETVTASGISSLVPRPSHCPTSDLVQYERMEEVSDQNPGKWEG